MRFSQIIALVSSAALVAAAPAPVSVGVDDVILYSRDGRFQVMKRDDLDELKRLRESGVVPPKPNYLEENLIPVSLNETSSRERSHKKRDQKSLIIPNPPSRFLGWDVQTSQVVKGAPGGTKITVTVGYSISDSLSVSQSAQITLVKDFLSATTTVSYSKMWTTTQTQMFSADVPDGKYGAFVTNAWTNRASGNVWQGSVGGDGTLSYYQGDSYDEKAYGDLKWVDGVISLCTGDSFPLKRCLGEGTL